MVSTRSPIVVPLNAPDDLEQAARLYREVFGYDDPDHAVNPKLLSSLRRNGGSVVGAHGPGGELVAFAYGFVGVDGGQIYHYSQAAVVHAHYQGRGLGRALKQGQREIALAGGQTWMRWSYDPALVRNGHFNLDVLGAVGRWFRPDFYGLPGTDRVIVEWDLDDDRRTRDAVAAADPPEAPELAESVSWLQPHPTGQDVWLPLPAELAAGAELLNRPEAELRAALARSIGELIDSGHVLTSCQRLTNRSAVYRFVRTGP